MFCSNCGVKIEEKDKFCPKCGKSVSAVSSGNEKDKGGKSVTTSNSKPNNNCCLSCLFAFFLMLALFVVASGSIIYSSNKNRSTELILGIIIFSLTFFVLGIWGLISQYQKNHLKSQVPDKINEDKAKVSETKSSVPKSGGNNAAIGWCVGAVIVLVLVPLIVGTIYYISHPNKTGPTEPTGTTSENWDGNYTAQMSKPNCDSSVEFTDFQVVDNAVVNNWGQNAPIGTDGNATIVMDTGTVMTTNLTFTKDGVNGTWKTSRGCSGSLTANKSRSWF